MRRNCVSWISIYLCRRFIPCLYLIRPFFSLNFPPFLLLFLNPPVYTFYFYFLLLFSLLYSLFFFCPLISFFLFFSFLFSSLLFSSLFCSSFFFVSVPCYSSLCTSFSILLNSSHHFCFLSSHLTSFLHIPLFSPFISPSLPPLTLFFSLPSSPSLFLLLFPCPPRSMLAYPPHPLLLLSMNMLLLPLPRDRLWTRFVDLDSRYWCTILL